MNLISRLIRKFRFNQNIQPSFSIDANCNDSNKALYRHIENALHKNNMKVWLNEDEMPFAVLWSTTRFEDALKEAGVKLQSWKDNTFGVKQILGLEKMTQG